MFETRGLGRIFSSRGGVPVHAVEELSLSVPRGAFFLVTGPSGSGKTTLLALLGLLDRPTAGSVLVDSRDLARASEAERSRFRRRLGIVFQQAPMVRGLPIWENVTYPLVPRGVRTVERRRIGAELLERVGIVGRDGARPAELSGGELQRVGVARALVADPDAILADEPTSDLDPESAAAVVALFRTIHAAQKTVVVASHDPAFLALATHTCQLEK